MNENEQQFPAEKNGERRKHAFYPSAEMLAGIPPLYGTENTSTSDTVVHLHYSVGRCDWYIAEVDPESLTAFGWAEVTPGCGEWGYSSLTEMEELNAQGYVIERDVTFKPVRAGDVARINGTQPDSSGYQYSEPLTAQDAERLGELLGLTMATCAQASSAKTGLSLEFFLRSYAQDDVLDALGMEFLSHIAAGETEATAAERTVGWLLKATAESLDLAVELHGSQR
ncbi:DUF2958 domain-containing protein [Streptomyces sp. NBC_00237]|uniref:DUF2958 domain-containing protein n=1 Tax=Streptomyces sp. NBC_00237 TaxID=2975687 RepID=UPI00224E1FD5|nr:DUF2958 domain-containing protein [Streptomyces sp. NBC_00237]MCX5206108.1 DUF2958 domain-containing protein [Streptomyces sp. NBC_00237]